MAGDGGISKLEKRLKAIPQQVREAVQPTLQKQAGGMVSTMRHLVPKDTHALEESIQFTPGGQRTPAYSQPGGSMTVPENMVAITVGNTDVRYGHLVEYGTMHANAQPFFWPAVRLHNKKAKASVKRAIGRAVKKNWGKP
ncbi:MAG: HK97 gp10 family phage protein [Hyphomicrobiaceae bacterium]|nr:HK97 gp10 family phage protein [Hyphomicrobiaceae bacterium]